MDKVILTRENIGQEHICCAMSDKKSAEGVEAKEDGRFLAVYHVQSL